MNCRKKYCSSKNDEEFDEDGFIVKKSSKPKKSFVGTVYYIAPEMLVK